VITRLELIEGWLTGYALPHQVYRAVQKDVMTWEPGKLTLDRYACFVIRRYLHVVGLVVIDLQWKASKTPVNSRDGGYGYRNADIIFTIYNKKRIQWMNNANISCEGPLIPTGPHTSIREAMSDNVISLKDEMNRIGRTEAEFLTLQERAAVLVGANQVLRYLEDHAKRVLDPPPADRDFYDIPLMKLNQGVTANQIRGIKRFISSMGDRMEGLPLPLNDKPD
jgi:hypothetical protein